MQEICTICAAGSAGEALVYGGYGQLRRRSTRCSDGLGASGNRLDVEGYDRAADYDLLVDEAKKILLGRRASFDRLARMLKWKLLCSNDELTMELLPVGKMGAFVLNQSDLALRNGIVE